MLVQKFVAENRGKDIRAFVVGDRVVAAMRRVAQGQQFRSNVHRGGVAEAVDLSDKYRETAVRTAQILGLRNAGVDIRQRLTVSRGYGVSEILIRRGSNFDGKTITETSLRDSDINVLTLYSGSTVIPNPRNDRALQANDRLLCFGRLDAMRDLLPPRAQRRRHPVIKDLDPSAAA